MSALAPVQSTLVQNISVPAVAPTTSSAAPIDALPKTVSLQLLHAFALEKSPVNLSSEEVISIDTIWDCVGKKDLFALKKQLHLTIAREWAAQKFNYELRGECLKAVMNWKAYFAKEIKTLQDCQGKYPELPPADQSRLHLFATEGRGGESVRIFAKILLDPLLDVTDEKYLGRIMTLATGKFQMRIGDTLPTSNGPFVLTKEKAAPLKDKNGQPEDKYPCDIEGSLFLEERVARQTELYEAAVKGLTELSKRIPSFIKKLDLTMLIGCKKLAIFLRGEQGVGKSRLLSELLGLQEKEVFNSDTLKEDLGGTLCHHEAAALNDKIVKNTSDLECTLNVKTNIKKRDVSTLVEPKGEKTMHIIIDIYASSKTVEARLAQRDSLHVIGKEEREMGHQESVQYRFGVIEGALKDHRVSYQLYSNDGGELELIAHAPGESLLVRNPIKFLEALKHDVGVFKKS